MPSVNLATRENLRAALEAAAAGAYVFPALVAWNDTTKKIDKRPAISGWREAASKDPEQLKQWWGTFTEAVPGIEVGRSGLFVVDLDKHPGGADGIANFEAFRGSNPAPQCPTVKTPSGGYHLYFKQPEGAPLGNRTGSLPKGVDCRGDGGWTVAPGATFGPWVWAGNAAKISAAPPVPAWIFAAVQARKTEHSPEPAASGDIGKRERAYAEAALRNEAHKLAGTAPGTRNAALNTAAFCLGGMIARSWIGQHTVEGALLDACLSNRLAQDDGRPAVLASLRSGLEAGLKQPHADLLEREHSEPPKTNGHAPPRQQVHLPPQPESIELVMRKGSDIKIEPVRWLWDQRIAIGKLSLLAGEPGLSKSQLTLWLAAAVTTGDVLPSGETAPCGSVIILSAEDTPKDTIIPRLRAVDADLNRIRIVSMVRETRDGVSSHRSFDLQLDLPALEQAITELADVRLIIIDPIASYMGKRIDSHKNSEVRAVLEPVATFAAKHKITVLGVTHFSKGAGPTAINKFIGSIAFIAAARSAFVVTMDPESEDEGRRLFLPVKNNLARLGHGLAFVVEQTLIDADGTSVLASRIHWLDETIERNANAVLAALAEGHDTAINQAEDFLREYLAGGRRRMTELQEAAKGHGHAWRTMERAKRKLQIVSINVPETDAKEGKPPKPCWYWELPPEPGDGG